MPDVRCQMLHVRERGFTLVEFIVYTAIFSFIILFLIQMLISLVATNARTRAREAVITNAVHALGRIDYEIRHANEAYPPTSDFTSTTRGQLSVVSALSPAVSETVTYADIYVSDDLRLCIKKETTGVECITSDEVEVVGLDFNRIQPLAGPEGVQTVLTLEYKTNDADNRANFFLQSSTNFRDYD